MDSSTGSRRGVNVTVNFLRWGVPSGSRLRNLNSSCVRSFSSNASRAGDGGDGGDGPERKLILVVGGNGFIGSRVCKEALDQGYDVASLSRSGTPAYTKDWMSDVQYIKGDVFGEVEGEYETALNQACGVVSCLGAFGSKEFMLKVNGEGNARVINVAKEHKVPRFSYISARHLPFRVPDPISGYVDGKALAETTLREVYQDKGTVVRAGVVTGSREVSVGGMTFAIPLWLIFSPLKLFHTVFNGLAPRVPSDDAEKSPGTIIKELLFYRTISAEDVARAAVAGVTDPKVFGTLEVEHVNEILSKRP